MLFSLPCFIAKKVAKGHQVGMNCSFQMITFLFLGKFYNYPKRVETLSNGSKMMC